jgi:tripartite-type tricarboxylate transporter receptor subunit TctC
MNFDAVIAEAKKKPGALKVGVIPNNTFEYVTEIIEKNKGVKFSHVPFQGGKPGVTALLGGHIDLTNAFYEEIEQYVRAGSLRVIAVSDNKRFKKLPDAPAMTELGIAMPGGTWGASRVVLTPKGTPSEIRKYLEASFLKVLKDPKTVEAYDKIGAVVEPTDTAATMRVYNDTYNAMQNFLKESGRAK